MTQAPGQVLTKCGRQPTTASEASRDNARDKRLGSMAGRARMECFVIVVSAHILIGVMASQPLTSAESQQVSPAILRVLF